MNRRYDFIVVGGGSSGCVAAARLVTEGDARVLLLEAGHSHRHPLLDMPPGIFKMINGSKYMRYHKTVPQEHLGGRVHDIPQANVLGGGSSVNAQVYMRGRPSDYDEWHELLRRDNDYPGWSWNDVLPHFRNMEGNNRLFNNLHGAEGPLLVSDPGHINEYSRWFVQAVQAMGEPYNPDFNGSTQRGVGFYQFMNRSGRRSSAAYAFIAPLAENSKLTVALNAAVERIEGFLHQDARRRVLRILARHRELFFNEPAVLSRSHLPGLVGTSREMTGRVLRQLEREGTIERVGRLRRSGSLRQRLVWILLAGLAVAICIAIRYYHGPGQAQAVTPLDLFKKPGSETKSTWASGFNWRATRVRLQLPSGGEPRSSEPVSTSP